MTRLLPDARAPRAPPDPTRSARVDYQTVKQKANLVIAAEDIRDEKGSTVTGGETRPLRAVLGLCHVCPFLIHIRALRSREEKSWRPKRAVWRPPPRRSPEAVEADPESDSV